MAFLALGLLIFFAPAIVARTALVQSLASKALADFDGTVTIGSASLGWFSSVELHDLVVRDSQGRAVAVVPRIVTSQSLIGIIADRRNLGSVTLERPTVEIVCEGQSTNLETSLRKILEKPSDSTTPSPTLKIITTDAALKIIDADTQREWTFGEANSVVELGPRPRLHLKIAKPDALECDVCLGQPITATLHTERFPIDAVGPLLRRFEPGLDLSGRLSGQVVTEVSGSDAKVHGALELEDLSASSARLGTERVTVARADLPFQITTAGSQVRVQSMRLTSTLGSAALSGNVDVNEPPERLLQTSGITASVNADVAAIARMLPKLLRLRPGTELQDGRIEIHLASATSTKGTVWKGQAKATALKGLRDGQPLRWEQPILATFTGRVDERWQPDLDALEVASDFIAVSARGRLEDFRADATISLDKLTNHLKEFIDFSGTTLSGRVELAAAGKPVNSETIIDCRLQLDQLQAAGSDWRLGGHGNLSGTVRYSTDRITADGIQGTLQNFQFRGRGLDVDEPTVKVLPTDAVLDRKTGQLTIPKLQASSQTISLLVSNFTQNRNQISGTLAFNGHLGRLQKTLRLGGEPLNGMLANGTLELVSDGNATRFHGKLPIQDFHYGQAQSPIWSEPLLTANLRGAYDASSDSLTFDTASLERPDGLAALATGSVRSVSTKQTLDLSGQLSYDLAALTPQLRSLLGTNVSARGKDRRPFHLRGELADPTLLIGDASLGWESVSAYGFDVGAGNFAAKLEQSVLTANAIEARFNGNGTVRIQPTIRLKSPDYDLSFRKGRVIDRATLTPAACADALGYALPAIARAAKAEGTLSLDLDDHYIPLADLRRCTLKGKLTLHNVEVTPGPVLSSIVTIFAAQDPRMVLAKEQGVAIRIENGRVFHETLTLKVGNYTLSTSGSVGFDGTLALTAQLPLPENALGPLLKGTPKLREALAGKQIAVAIGGTLAKPVWDRRAFDAAIAKLIAEASRDAAKGKLEDLLNKGLEKALPKKP